MIFGSNDKNTSSIDSHGEKYLFCLIVDKENFSSKNFKGIIFIDLAVIKIEPEMNFISMLYLLFLSLSKVNFIFFYLR